MTVASLWKALDRAGCGKYVGVDELLDHHGTKSKTNPWNVREMNKLSRSQSPVLAIDLSIWICEALASSAMKEIHVADPTLQLVYSRTLKLLNLGIKLVAVVEGKRRNRIRKTGLEDEATGNPKPTEDKFRKRRSGTLFWTACERCEKMLKLLGVIVVRANAEGEALCALLNQRGIVDGVISNDGDCLLFGAKVLYTKFSVENLNSAKVLRYDADAIRVLVDDDDADRFDETRQRSKDGEDIVELSRKDLIAFAILTGSDLAGDGLSKVGCRKAIRFIRKCQIDNPLKLDGDSSPAIEQLLSWEHTAVTRGNLEEEGENISGPRCSCCGHPGTKRDHKKYGCKGCGTEPGEPCFQLSPGGRFRKQLRAKALSMQSAFDPSSTLRAYLEPNENQIPLCLVGKTARRLEMNPPRSEELLELPYVIRGRSLQESREFIRKSLSVYLARQELLELASSKKLTAEGDASTTITKLPRNHNRPTPLCVRKLIVRNGKSSCEVQWVIKATTSDAEGNPLDEYRFSTIEDESIIQKCHPKLLQEFLEEQKKVLQQGTAEQEKRRNFLISMEKKIDGEAEIQLNGGKKCQTRKNYFDQTECIRKHVATRKGLSDDVEVILIQATKKEDNQNEIESKKADVHIGRVISTETNGFRDCYHPERRICRQGEGGKELVDVDTFDRKEVPDDSSTICTVKLLRIDINTSFPNPREDYYFRESLTPGHEYYLDIESAFQFRCMAGVDYNPRSHCKEINSMEGKSELSAESNKEKLSKTRFVRKEAFSGKHGLESMSSKGFPIAGNCSNEESCYECSCAKRSPKEVFDGIIQPMNENLNLVTVIEQKVPSRDTLSKRRKDKVVEHIVRKNDTCFHDKRSTMKEGYPTTRFSMSNFDSSTKIHVKTEHIINVDGEDPYHHTDRRKQGIDEFRLYPFGFPNDKCNKSIDKSDEPNPARLPGLEFDRRFDNDQCQVGCYDLRGKGEYQDQFQSDSRDFDYESYGIQPHIWGGKERKRSWDQQAEFCGFCVKNHHMQSGIDYNNGDNATCCSLHHRQGDCSCDAYENRNAHKQIKTCRTKILEEKNQNIRHEQQRRAKHRKKVHHFGIRNQDEDESNCREPCRLYCKRDRPRRDKYCITRSKAFNVLHPLSLVSESEYRNHSEYVSSKSFEAIDDRQEEYIPEKIWNQEIDQPVLRQRVEQESICGRTCCQSKRDYRQYQSKSMDTLNLDNEIEVTERIEIEKRIAEKAAGRNRRARVSFLCSKYIEQW